MHGGEKECIQNFRGESERPRHRWEDNIKMDLRDIGWGGIDWINLAQDMDEWRALVNVIINLWVP
jgi:hypothetical protein